MFRSLYNWYYRLTISMQAADSDTLEAELKETKIQYLKKLNEEEDFTLLQQIAAVSADHYANRMHRIETQLEKIYARNKQDADDRAAEKTQQYLIKEGPAVSYADA